MRSVFYYTFFFAQGFGLTSSSSYGEYGSVTQSASDLLHPLWWSKLLAGACILRRGQGSWQQPCTISPPISWVLRTENCHALSLQDSSGLQPPHPMWGWDIQNTTQRHMLHLAPVAHICAMVWESSFSPKWPQTLFLLSSENPGQKILLN